MSAYMKKRKKSRGKIFNVILSLKQIFIPSVGSKILDVITKLHKWRETRTYTVTANFCIQHG